MKTRHLIGLATLLGLGNSTLTAAPLGTAFAYQAGLWSGTNAANGIFDLRFAIFDLADGGSPLTGPITNSAVGVTNGLFTTTVDFGPGICTGEMGIGRTPAANTLQVERNASKTTAGSWLAHSDAGIKQDILTVTNALETLGRVRLVSFRYSDPYRAAHPEVRDQRYLNAVAHEFAEVFPEHVRRSGEKLPDGSETLTRP